MRNLILIVVGCIELAGNIPYIIDILKAKTRPNIASWSTFALINIITFVAALSAGNALNTVIISFFYMLGTGVILVLALYKGTRKYSRFDLIFQILSLVGIGLWLLAKNPAIAIGFSIVIGNLAALPMLRHAYQYPYEETWITFLISTFAAIVTLGLASGVSFAALAVPIDLIIGNGTLTAIILVRRSQQTTL